jgi:hypothetical protein
VSDAVASNRRHTDRRILALFVAGLALSAVLALRSQAGGDQLNLLARGWLLVAEGQWIPYGNPSSSGGAVPGGVTALLVGGPLWAVSHHRAAVVGVLLTQMLAFLLLDRWLRQALPNRERLLFAVVYWLNPWRLVLSGFLWNPGYLFLVGAVHAVTTWRQRRESHAGASLLHGAALAVGFQVHPSVVLLGMATLLLLLTRNLRVRWWALIAGGAIGALPLLPWLIAVSADPEMLPVSKGFLGRGLLLVFPLLRGALYWLRHASLYLSSAETELDFGPAFESPALAGSLARPLEVFGEGLVNGLGVLSIALPLLANVWLWRGIRRRGWRRLLVARAGRRAWVLAYSRICCLAALVVYGLAPTTVMWWQGVSLLHAAVLPLALWGGAMARRRRRRWVPRLAWLWGSASAAVALLIAFGGPRHRCGGDECIVLALRHDHRMLHELSLHATCPISIEPGGWWPDVLPEPAQGLREGDAAPPPPGAAARPPAPGA